MKPTKNLYTFGENKIRFDVNFTPLVNNQNNQNDEKCVFNLHKNNVKYQNGKDTYLFPKKKEILFL